jgi:LPS export ABC transporter protein LptC
MSKWYKGTVVVAIATVIGVGIYTLFASRQTLDQIGNASSTPTDAGLTLTNVTLEEPDSKGGVLWKVFAKEVTYSPDQQVAKVKYPKGEFYQNGKKIYQVTGDRGEIRRNGETLLVQGNVVATATENDLVLKGDSLEWTPKQDLLLVRDRITGEHPDLKANAKEARFFNQAKRLELKGEVKANTTKAPWLRFQTEAMTWQIKAETLLSEQPLTIEQFSDQSGETITERLVGKQGEFNLKDNIAKLTQTVQLDLLKLPLRATSEIAIWDVDGQTVAIDQPVEIQQTTQQISAKAEKAQIDLKTQIIYLISQVRAVAQKNGSQLMADRAQWQLDTQDVEAEGNIRYQQSDPPVTLTGDRAVGNLAAQTVTVSGGETGKPVITEIVPP